MKRICAVFLLCSVSFGWAQQVSVFEGEVVRAPGVDRGALSVELLSFGGQTHSVDLGSDGRFRFSEVPIGNYLLRVVDSGGNEITTQPLRLVPMTAPIEVRLPASKVERPTGETVSVARLRHVPDKRAWRQLIKAQGLAESGRHEQAVAELEKALTMDPDFIEARGNLGAEYAVLHRYESAATELQRAIALDPASSQYQSNLAFVFLNLHQPDEATTSARKAVELDGSNLKARYVLGCALINRAETRASGIQQLQIAARTFPLAHRTLASVYQSLGRTDLAEQENRLYQQSVPAPSPAASSMGLRP